jgi:predicted neutral ceramidase superfamily lipid hydrolase
MFKQIQEMVDNQYVSTLIIIVLALYVSLLGPNISPFVRNLFNNIIFRILVLFLIVIRANQDPKMAIMIAIAFVLTLDYIYVLEAKEVVKKNN